MDALQRDTLFAAAFEQSLVAMAMLSVPDYRFIEINAVGRQLMAEWCNCRLGLSVHEICPQMAGDIVSALDRVRQTGQPEALRDVRMPEQAARTMGEVGG